MLTTTGFLSTSRENRLHNMEKKRYGDLHDELLRKRFYENIMSSIFTGKTQPPVESGILNGYIAQIVSIGNTNGSKLLKSHPVVHSPHRKPHKAPRDSSFYCFQDALQDIPEEHSEFSDMLENCPDHTAEVLKYFCETCGEPICLDCTMGEHRKHRFTYLSDVYHKQTHNMGSLLSQGKVQIETTRRSLNEVKNLLSKLNDGKEEMETTIRENTTRLIDALQDREKELLCDLDSAYHSKEAVLRKEKEHLELILERVNGSCQCAEKAIKIGNELEMLVIQKHLKRKLKEVKNTRRDFNSVEFQKVHYFTREDAVSIVQSSLGKIVISDTCPENSVAIGEGLVRGKIGSPAAILITTKDYNDQTRSRGGDSVSINVQSPTKEVKSEIEDQGDGTYSAYYTPSESGNHEVAIEIHNQPIKDSPFQVLVSSPRDYGSITRPGLIFGGLGEGKGKLKLPCGAAVDEAGRIVVADCHNHRIQIFDAEGRHVRCFGSLGEKNGQLNNPTDVSIDKQGNIYVCDKDNHRIQTFTKDGVFLSKFGGQGEEAGRFKRPWGVALSSSGQIIVTDRRNSRVQVFNSDGALVKTFGSHGRGKGQLDNPYHAVLDSDTGDIYVTDGNNHRVQVFDANGNHVRQFGNDGADSHLKYPTGIALDGEGHVLVGDQYNHRIQVYSLDGRLVTSISLELQGLGYKCYPKGLAVGTDGRVVVVDSDNHRVIML